ncbi:TolC family protein [Caminibacter sp.]
MTKLKIENGKWKILLFFPVFLFAESFSDIVKKIDNSYLYKLSKNEVILAKKTLKATKAMSYGKVDLSYTGFKFFETPKMKITSPTPVAVAPDGVHLIYENITSTLPMSKSTHFIGEIKYSYPIFTGFRITNAIKAAKIKLIKSRLEFDNTKRVLILNSAKLYAGIYALNSKIDALNFEKKALSDALSKAEALFEEGLVDKSTVDDVKAKYYEVVADIEESKSKRDSLLNTFSSLLNVKIKKIDGVRVYSYKNLNAANRPDVKAIYENLNLAKINIKLQKAAFYPEVGFEAALKKEADNIFLNKNDFQNIDKSYLGIGIKYNLFNGGADKINLQKAKIQEINALLYYKNYLNNAKTELKNDLREIKALKYRLKAAKNEIKARSVYYEKIKAKFNEGLADSVDLNSAIAKLAAAKAKKEYIKSQLFFYTIKAKLDGGESINEK